jgi:hypothetical protein
MKKTFAVLLALSFIAFSAPAWAGGSVTTPGFWSNLIHEENSVVASVTYIPYMILKVPVGMVYGIIYPAPTTQATVTPYAHRSHRQPREGWQ